MNIEKELAVLKRLSVDQLRSHYAELFGEATNARHKEWLIKRILWRKQALAEGGLSDRARQQAQQLACEADLRLSPPKPNSEPRVHQVAITKSVSAARRLPAAGTVIVRPYKGRELQLKVLVEGFEYEGETFASLSAAAKKITGSHCNGYQFFRLAKAGARS